MLYKFGTILIVMLLLLGVHNIVIAKDITPELKKELDEIKEGQKALHEEIKFIKDMLLKGNNPTMPVPSRAFVYNVEFELGDNPVIGNESAPLVVIEFSDYQCSFCARHTKETYPDIFEKYIKTGKLRYVFMDKPLPGHNMANEAVGAAYCASKQGKFIEMHNEMMSNQDAINDLTSLATSIDLDINQFKNCMASKDYNEKLAKNLELASKLQISGVPCFVLASKDHSNPQKVKGISFIQGALPLANFQMVIDTVLADLNKNKI
jgi:protein-disulfide isomerase